jgi:hypothetical protein
MALGFRGMFALTEGETFDKKQNPFRNVQSGFLSRNPDNAALEITLQDFEPQLQIGDIAAEASKLGIRTSGNRYQDLVYFNHGLRLEEGVLHQQKWGFSPGVIIKKSKGSMVFNSFVRLASLSRRGETFHRDQVQLADGTRLSLELTADPMSGFVSPAEPVLQGPMLELSLHNGLEELFHGRLKVGETALMNGYLVAFPRYRHWAQFELVRDPGLPVLIGGFILVVIGLLVRIIFVRQMVAVSIQRSSQSTLITISGWSEKFPASFKENLNALICTIETDLQEDTQPVVDSLSDSLKPLTEASHATC